MQIDAVTWADGSGRGLIDLAERLFGISISHNRPYEYLNLAISVHGFGAHAQLRSNVLSKAKSSVW